jgi:tyrosine-protein kinase Etk/Wzc
LEEFRNHSATDSIDFNKFRVTIRHNLFWIALIFTLTNLTAILYVRYTKDLYESESEIKLDVKQDATELGIREITQDKNINLISGEIETIQSKLFLNNVIDSLNLNVSYYSIGQLLNYELYKSSPFTVNFISLSPTLHNTPFYVDQKNSTEYELRIGEKGESVTGTFNKPLTLKGCILILSMKPFVEFQKGIDYSFVYNSRESLLEYLKNNLTVEPLNFNAKTIKVAFKDNNPFKARDLVNGIDSLYLRYSNEQKNLANKQKIDWLTRNSVRLKRKWEVMKIILKTSP